MEKNHLDKTYIGLNEMWTKNNGTKIIRTKLVWEQRVSGLKDFGRNLLDQAGQGLKCFGRKVFGLTLYRTYL